MKKVVKAIFQVFLGIVAVAVAWVLYESYFVDHTIHYQGCGAGIPISVPFSLGKKGKRLSCQFMINNQLNHQVSIRYFYTKENFETVLSLAGGWSGSIKARPPIKLQYEIISLPQEKSVLSGIGENPNVGMNQSNSYVAKVFNVHLMPGEYKLIVESLIDAPELNALRTELYVDLSPISK